MSNRKPRVLFFVFSGKGLGHLKRLTHIANAVAEQCDTLIMSSHQAASWIVPTTCEYRTLPDVDNLPAGAPGGTGRKPNAWMRYAAIHQRKQRIDTIVEEFNPDAIVVDFLPLGKHSELKSVLEKHTARKYLILRGVVDEVAKAREDMLENGGREALENHYHRILVAADRNIIDIDTEYGFGEAIAQRVQYVGYVMPALSRESRQDMRYGRGLLGQERWVVCSSGSGWKGEALTEACWKIAAARRHEVFDIILGPNSRWHGHGENTEAVPSHVCFREETPDLPRMHSACDLVICHGGYNTIMEAMSGGARLLVVETPGNVDAERRIHAQRLGRFYPIVLTDIQKLPECMVSMLDRPSLPALDIREQLNCSGLNNIRNLLFSDLHV
jgi:predicted glycosyltransferase